MTAGETRVAGGVATPIGDRRTWLWDLDGTLVDSARVHETAFRDAITQISPGLLDAFRYDAHAGASTREVLCGLGVDSAVTDRLVRRKQELYRHYVDAGRVEAFRGAHRILDQLAGGGAGAYLVTSGSRGSVERVLASCSLEGRFLGVQTSDDVSSSKPDPAVYREACRRWAADPDDVVVVEDSLHGVQAAVGAGLVTLQVHTTDAVAGATAVGCLDEIAILLRPKDEWQ